MSDTLVPDTGLGLPPCYAVIVPDESADSDSGAPRCLEADNPQTLCDQVYPILLSLRRGWCYVFMHGQRARVSQPRRVFRLECAGMAPMELGLTQSVAWTDDGRFEVQ